MSRIIALIACVLFSTTPLIVLANNTGEVTITNHYNKPLKFMIGINPDALPNLPAEFYLAPNQSAKSQIVPDKEAYIRAEEKDNDENSGFFGVEYVNNKVVFHGYISKNIAFSWGGNQVIFCTPEDYKKVGHCT